MEFLRKNSFSKKLTSYIVVIITGFLIISAAAFILNALVYIFPAAFLIWGCYKAVITLKVWLASVRKDSVVLKAEAISNREASFEKAIRNNEVIDVEYQEL